MQNKYSGLIKTRILKHQPTIRNALLKNFKCVKRKKKSLEKNVTWNTS